MRGWMVSLGLAGMVVAAASVIRAVPSSGPAESPVDYSAEADPCFRYGRFECCVRPGED